jgi:actin-related protein
MAAYSPNDVVQAVVADLGQGQTKMGWAGEEYPKSYFRSNVAVSRKPENDVDMDTSKRPRRRPIEKVKYDFYTRPCDFPNDSDGHWETMNPVEATTGLWYDYPDQGDGGADWYDMMQLLLHHGFDSALGARPENHPLMLVEKSFNPPPIRQQVMECLMEEMNVPAAFLARDATLACYGCGSSKGTVVDIGYGGTVVTPVFDGYVETKGIRKSPMGVLAMDQAILKNLDELAKPTPFLPLYQVRKFSRRSDAFHRLARLDVARQARESSAGAIIAANSVENAVHAPHTPFKLPDGETVNVTSKMRLGVSDLLFGKDEISVSAREEAAAAHQREFASLVTAASHAEDDDAEDAKLYMELYSEADAVGLPQRKKIREGKKRVPFSNRHLQRACVPYLQNETEYFTSEPVSAMVCDAAFRCDRDQQAQLLGNVILAGGGACIGPTDQAVPEMLREQVEGIIHKHTPGWRVKVLSPGMQERAVLSWLGGSILGSLGTFHDLWITKSEYDEWGPSIVNRKCP